MKDLEKDLCGAIVGGLIAGPGGAIAGVIICHTLFSDKK